MRTEMNLSHSEAKLAIDTILKECEKRNLAAVIAVADSHGELLALLRMDNARISSVTIASNKAYSAARERVETVLLGKASRDPEKGFELANFGDPKFTAWGGGMPVIVDGMVVGSVAVSGLPQSDDIEMAKLAIDAILASLK